MTVNRRVDSAGAARWIRRAERLARNLKQPYAAKREIIDGYVVEGRRSGDRRFASVIDLPGVFALFRRVDVHTRDIDVLSSHAQSPTRRLMLEEYERPDDPREFPLPLQFEPEPADLYIDSSVVMGAPPEQAAVVGHSPPVVTPRGVTSAVLIASPPTPQLFGPLWVDYSAIQDVWIQVRFYPAGGGAYKSILVNEQILTSVFGAPVIQKSVVGGIFSPSVRCMAVVNGDVLSLVVLLRDSPDPPLNVNTRTLFDRSSIGFISLRLGIDASGDPVPPGEPHTPEVVSHARLGWDELPHPLFVPHPFLYDDHPPFSETPVIPPQYVSVGFSCMSVASDGESVWLSTNISQPTPATLDVPDTNWSGYVYITGRLLCKYNILTGAIESSIDHVDCDSRRNVITPLEGNMGAANELLVTSAGLRLSDHLENPWDSPEWVCYCAIAHDGTHLIDVVGLALGERGDTLEGGIMWRAPMQYREVPFALVVNGDRTELDGMGFVPGIIPGASLVGARQLGSAPALNATARLDWYPIASIGGGRFEIPMYHLGGDVRQGVARVDGTDIAFIPDAPEASAAISTCFAMGVFDDDTGEYTPHRSIAAFNVGGQYTIQLRDGDEVVAETVGVEDDFRLGVFYVGNPFALAKYGRFGYGQTETQS